MTLAVMQPYLFPYLGYWQLINVADMFVIFDDVNYINKGYINRNNILINDNPWQFTLELIGASQNRLINEIQIGNNQKKILKTIEMAYRKAPYFDAVFPMLQDILNNEEKNLAKFVGFSIERVANYLGLETKYLFSSQIEKDNTLKAQSKIIHLAGLLNADEYINAIGGQHLYQREEFKKHDIELYFLKTDIKAYKQFEDKFIPGLSIIDVMMFNSVDEIKTMLQAYELI